MIKEIGETFADGLYIIYVNGSYKDDNDPIGKLMHDFRCTEPDEMFYSLLAKQVRYFKETEGGRGDMCKAVEELVEKRAEERAVKLVEKKAVELAEKKAVELVEKKATELAIELAEKKLRNWH